MINSCLFWSQYTYFDITYSSATHETFPVLLKYYQESNVLRQKSIMSLKLIWKDNSLAADTKPLRWSCILHFSDLLDITPSSWLVVPFWELNRCSSCLIYYPISLILRKSFSRPMRSNLIICQACWKKRAVIPSGMGPSLDISWIKLFEFPPRWLLLLGGHSYER